MRYVCGVAVSEMDNHEQVIAELDYRLDMHEHGIRLFFVNAHTVNHAVQNSRFREVLNRSDMNMADGIGMWLAGMVLHRKGFANLNGTDFGWILLNWAAGKRFKVFLLGAREGVAERAVEKFQSTIKNLDIVGVHHGYFGSDEMMIETINSFRPDLLIVCLGTPRQEKWIDQNYHRICARILAGMGGLLDFQSGDVPRAPHWVRKIRCEWIFRLLMEPHRLWRRYLGGNPLFLWRVFLQLFSAPRNVHGEMLP